MNIQFHNSKMHNKLKEVMRTWMILTLTFNMHPTIHLEIHGAYAPWKETSQVGSPVLHMLSYSCSKLELATH